MLRRIAAAAIVLLAAACGGDDDPLPSDGGYEAPFDLSVEPATLSLAAGEAGIVRVGALRRDGLTGAVGLAVVGAPADVTSAGALLEGDSVELTVEATAEARPGSRTVWVRGTAEGGTNAVRLLVEVLPSLERDVAGRVVDSFRRPVAGATVHLAGGSVSTDGDGAFAFSDVLPPYDPCVERMGEGGAELHCYPGLTRVDPTLHLVTLIQPPVGTANLGGNLPDANGADEVTFVALGSDHALGSSLIEPGSGPAFGPAPVQLLSTGPVEARVHALRWRMDTWGLPAEYLGTWSEAIAVSAGDTIGPTIAFGPVETGFLSGEISLPDGYTVFRKALWLAFGRWTAIPLAIEEREHTTFTWAAPLLTEPLGVLVSARDGSGRPSHVYLADVGPSAALEITVPEAPSLGSPAAGATGVDGDTAFTWTAPPQTVRIVTVLTAGGPSFGIYTAGDEATLPSVGPAPSPTTEYGWGVAAVGPYEDADAFAEADGGLRLFGLGQDVTLGRSTVRSLTTAD